MVKEGAFERLGLEKNHFIQLSISYLLIYILFMSSISFVAGGDIFDNQTVDAGSSISEVVTICENVTKLVDSLECSISEIEVCNNETVSKCSVEIVSECSEVDNSTICSDVEVEVCSDVLEEVCSIEEIESCENVTTEVVEEVCWEEEVTSTVPPTAEVSHPPVSGGESNGTVNSTVEENNTIVENVTVEVVNETGVNETNQTVENVTVSEPVIEEEPLVEMRTMSLMSEPMFSIQSMVGGVSREGFLTQSGVYNLTGVDEFIPLNREVLNLSHAFIISPNQMKQKSAAASTNANGLNSDDSFVSLNFHNTTHLRARRGVSDDAPVVVDWQVLEAMDEEFTVQRGETAYSGASLTVTDTIPNSVVPANSMSWFYIDTTYNANRGDVIQFYSDVTDSNTITFTREDTAVSTDINFRWEVVEWDLTKINGFYKGYTGAITGPDTTPDCFNIGGTVDKTSSFLFHQVHAINDNDGGLDSSARAGYIQDNSNVCFYDFDGVYTAGVKWFLIDFSDTTSREENIHVDWATADYIDDPVFAGTFDTSKSLAWVSGTCNGDGTAKPRHTQWFNFNGGASATGLHIERTYGGQDREYSWQTLELPYFENLESPSFSNEAVDRSIAGDSQVVRFSLDVTDASDSIVSVNGTIEGVNRSFTKGALNEWYYDYTCSGDKTVSFTYVEADDNGRPSRESSAVVSLVSVTCDSVSPVVNFVTPNTPVNDSDIGVGTFEVDVNIVESNFRNVTFDLYNSVGVNIESQTYTDGTRSHVFSGLATDVYFYNVTSCDMADNCGVSETRQIYIDSESPKIDYGLGVLTDSSIVSGDTIFVNITIDEPNFLNVTFNLYGPVNKENTYLDATRSVSWNLLPDGDYVYNVTAYDSYGHVNYTSSRSVTLDNELPVVSYESGVSSDLIVTRENFVFVNVSYVEDHYKNITFELFNSTGFRIQNSEFSDGTKEFNFTGLGDEIYSYNVTICDLANNCGASSTRTKTVDRTLPVVSFGVGTEADNQNFSRDWIFVKADVIESNFLNITFDLFTQSGQNVGSYSFADSTREYNFTSLSSGLYDYNVTVYDKAGNKGVSSTRRIGLDLTGPSINFVSPQPKAYGIATGLTLDVSVSDSIAGVDSCWWNLNDGINQSIVCGSSTTFDTSGDGAHTIKYYSNDTFGNEGENSVTFSVSTTGPAIVLNEPVDETFYSVATIVDFNYSTTDPDGVKSCSLYGDWTGSWHKNQTDYSFGLIGDDTDKTCASSGAVSCGEPESGTPFDGCASNYDSQYEYVNNVQLTDTEVVFGAQLDVTCNFNLDGTSDDIFIWYYNGTGWRELKSEIGTGTADHVVSFNADSIIGTHIVRCGISYNTDTTPNDFCANGGSNYYDNDDLSFEVVAPKEEGNFSVNLSSEGNYLWNVECNDSNSYDTMALFNNSLAVDLTAPLVDFGLLSLADGSRSGSSNLFVDASVTELNLKNITFDLFKEGVNVGSKTYFDETLNYTFTSLTDGVYQYNITVYDKAGRVGSSSTRSVEVDVTKPSGSNGNPSSGTVTRDVNQNLTVSVNDGIGLKDATLFVKNSTGDIVFSSLVLLTGLTTATIGVVYNFLYSDVFSWFYRVTDTVGNEFNTTSSSLEIDITSPVITFIGLTEDDNSVVKQDYVYLNVDIYEKNYKNVTFALYKSGDAPLIVQKSDGTREVNWTSLSDGVYQYNVTSYDVAGNVGVSETRTIILDNNLPVVSFNGVTLNHDSYVTGNSVTAQVGVIEPNEDKINFNIYNEAGSLAKPSPDYSDKRRSLTWNLLGEGIYYYNVSVTDKVGLVGSTETRKITIDNTLPIVNYGTGALGDYANVSSNWIFVNATVDELNFMNITFELYNSSGKVEASTFYDSTREYNFTGLSDGDYQYNVTVYDKAGQSATTATRNIRIDTVWPVVNFVFPTEDDLVIRNRNWVYLNTTVVEDNFKEIEFSLYESDGTPVNSQLFTDSTREYNFTGLLDNNYLYNVSVVDYSGNIGSSETRHIGLDSAGPIVNIVKPRSKTYGYNTSIPLEHTVSDTVSSLDSCWWNIDGGVNQSIVCNAATTFDTSVAPHTVNFYANDTFGNVGYDSVNFFISITGPAIELTTPVNDTFYGVASNVDFGFAANDPDLVDTCSLYGDWNGGWKKNETYSGNWADVGFLHRRDLTINNVGATTLTDYPIYLNVTKDYTHTGDYSDLKFYQGSCSVGGSPLSYEIEYYDSESADVWVKVPSVSAIGTTICMYYGNLDAEDTQDSANVWNNDYQIVYHMDAAGLDSATNNLVENRVSDVGSPIHVTSFLGDGIKFSNNNAWSMTNIAWWEAAYSARTHEVVFETSGDISSRQVLFSEGGGTNGIMMYIYAGNLYVRWWITNNDHVLSTPIAANTKYHSVMSYQNPGNYVLYLNGEEKGSGVSAFDVAAHTGDGAIGYTGTTGKDFHDLANSVGHYFTGTIYEFRGSNNFQTLDWANQTYQMIFDEAGTTVYQAEEDFIAFSVPVSAEGTYNWNVECNDTIGYVSQALDNYSFIVDVTSPSVSFGSGTKADSSDVGQDYVYVDVNLIENNFLNITFELFNQVGTKIKSMNYYDDTRNHNFTELSNGVYYYNVTVYDRANHIGVTSTRSINLDTSPPSGSLDTPVDLGFVNNVIQNLTGTFSDPTGLVNATVYVLNETGHVIYSSFVELAGVTSATVGVVYNFLKEGVYKWFYSVEDSVGNVYNTTNNTLNVDLSAPLIDYSNGVEASGGIFEREHIFVNVTSSDWALKNVTFDLYNDEGEVFSNVPGGNFINWTNLGDDMYYYNVTAYDEAGNSNSTKTRNITLDNNFPVINFGPGTLSSGSYKAGDTVSFDIVVTEPNEDGVTFYLYNSTGHMIRETDMPAGTRSISWNLLSPGTYYYNATVYDLVEHEAFTLTRSVILDATFPEVSFGFGTLANDSYVSQDFVYVKAAIVEDNFNDVTFTLSNQTSVIDNHTFSDTTREYNFTGLTDGVYYYNISSSDKAGNVNVSETRKITLDNLAPAVSFGGLTLADNTNNTNDWVYADLNVVEINEKDVLFEISNGGSVVNSTTLSAGARNINWTNLDSKVYSYNVTVTDLAGNKNSTEVRTIGLDYVGPAISILNPQPKAYGYNVSLPLNYIVNDLIVGEDTCWYNIDFGSNVTVPCLGSATFNATNGEHTLYFYANDTFGNMNSKNVTFLLSIYGPAVQLVEPVDDVFYSAGAEVFFNYTAEDPDGVDTCSLYGNWNGAWHLNQSENGFLSGNDTDQTCNSFWNGDCSVKSSALDDTWDDCSPFSASADESVQNIYLDVTSTNPGEFVQVTCEFDSYSNANELYIWYYNTTGWKNIYTGQATANEVFNVTRNIQVDNILGEHSIRCSIGYDDDPDALTTYCVDQGSYYDNDDINFTVVEAKQPSGFNVTLNEEGTHAWNVMCNDTNSYDSWAASNFSITFDVTNPVVDFGLNTLSDGTNVSQNFVYVNSSIVENNFENITFYLYNETALVDSGWFNDSTRDYTFGGLTDGVYYYNITVYDSAGRSGSSSTRQIMLDTKAPTGNLNSPAHNSYVKDSSQNLTASFNDENGLKEAVLFVFNSTGYLVHNPTVVLSGLSQTIGVVYDFLVDDVFTWFYQVEDSVGNKYNTTSRDLIVDTTLPVITFVPLTADNASYLTQNYIYLNVSVDETNFKNVTFELFNGEGQEEKFSFVNSKRDINWTLRADDEYFYNVTVWDKAGNVNSSETRVINLDNQAPNLVYASGTENNNENKSQSFIYVDVNLFDTNFENVTYELWNVGGIVNKTTYLTEVSEINWTGLSDSVYTYNVTVYDKAGQFTSLPTRKITLDTTKPLVSFVLPTESNGASLEQEFVYMKTTVSDTNFKNITYNLYDDHESVINSTSYLSLVNEINFTAASDNKTYFYDVNVYDFAGNSKTTERRNISLIDVTNPSLVLTSPQPKNYSYNKSIRIDYTVNDVHLDKCWYSLDKGSNITLPNCRGTSIDVADEVYHTIDLFVNDTLGYMNSSSVTFFVNSSLINTPTYKVIRGTSFVDGYVEAPVNEVDPSKSFILHTTRGSDNGPDSLGVISKSIDVNTISFENYVSGEPVNVEWSVVVGPEIKVQRGENSFTTEDYLDIAINSVNLSSSFVIVNAKLDSGDSAKNLERLWTAELLDETTLRVSRGANTASGVVSWQVVDWKGINVESGKLVILDGESFNTSTISNVELGKSFMMFSSNLISATDVDDSYVKGEFVDSTTLNFSRVGSHGDINISYFVVGSELFDVQSGSYTHLENNQPQEISLGYDLTNETRAFDLNSHKNGGTLTLYSTGSLTQTITDNNTITLQKGAGSGSGETNWFSIEVKDLNKPDISLVSPSASQNFSSYVISSFSYSVEDESPIINCSLYGDWGVGWHKNQSVSGALPFSSVDVGTSGFYKWAVSCTDLYGNTNMSLNRTFGAFLPATEPLFTSSNQTANDGTGNVLLDWTATVDTLEYRIYAGNLANNLSLLDTVTDTNYTDTTFSGQKRRFYRVESWNPASSNMSTKIIGAHVYNLKHNPSGEYSVKDRNWIGFPTNFTNLKNANDTLNEIPGLTSVTRLEPTTQKRVTCNEFSCPSSFSCTDTACNFDLRAGEGYEVSLNTSEAEEVNWSGIGVVYEPQDITLVYDESGTRFNKNWVSMTAYTNFKNGRDLLDDIGVADGATYWDPETQVSQGLIKVFPGFYLGENFDVDMEKGYEVSVTEDKLWRQN